MEFNKATRNLIPEATKSFHTSWILIDVWRKKEEKREETVFWRSGNKADACRELKYFFCYYEFRVARHHVLSE
jgi:hypothetical protein